MLGTLSSINICVNEYLPEQSGLTSTLSSEACPEAGESKQRCRARHLEPLLLEARGPSVSGASHEDSWRKQELHAGSGKRSFSLSPALASHTLPPKLGSYFIPGINQRQKVGSVARITWLPQRQGHCIFLVLGPFPKAGAMLQL